MVPNREDTSGCLDGDGVGGERQPGSDDGEAAGTLITTE